MSTLNRRAFLQTAAAAAAVASGCSKATGSRKGIRLGVVVGVPDKGDPEPAIARVSGFGLTSCQLEIQTPSLSMAGPLMAALERHKVEATVLGTLGPGKMVWDFIQGPTTIGFVPRETRSGRIDAMKNASELARKCGIPAIHTHCGFLPERADDPVYAETIAAVKEVAAHCKKNGQILLCETGQETPITLLRAMQDVGLDNVAVNLDTANLILYGKGNPVDAMDVIGKRVWALHAKDGKFPTDPSKLGEEVPIGQGKVDFPQLFRRLKEVGFQGPVNIEREIEGPQQGEDIKRSIDYLQKLINEVYGSPA